MEPDCGQAQSHLPQQQGILKPASTIHTNRELYNHDFMAELLKYSDEYIFLDASLGHSFITLLFITRKVET
jgi:hypothetical protein